MDLGLFVERAAARGIGGREVVPGGVSGGRERIKRVVLPPTLANEDTMPKMQVG